MYPVFPFQDHIAAVSLPPGRVALPRLIEYDKYFPRYPADAPHSGRVIYIDPIHGEDLHANLRIFDRSRDQTSWGTEVPVVREKDLRSQSIEIFPVPLKPQFRQSLRIYDPFRLGNAQVEIRFYQTRTSQLVATRRVSLPIYERTLTYGGLDRSFPGLAELNNLMVDVPELTSVPNDMPLRIEVISLTPGLRFWAMVSLTNNDTQQVTLVTPQ